MKNDKDNKFGKPWQNHKTYHTYEKANEERKKLLLETNREAKVKRRGNNKFVVKTRVIKNEDTDTTN